jgi:hypothetical protein
VVSGPSFGIAAAASAGVWFWQLWSGPFRVAAEEHFGFANAVPVERRAAVFQRDNLTWGGDKVAGYRLLLI